MGKQENQGSIINKVASKIEIARKKYVNVIYSKGFVQNQL
jgi:hypothetical protein